MKGKIWWVIGIIDLLIGFVLVTATAIYKSKPGFEWSKDRSVTEALQIVGIICLISGILEIALKLFQARYINTHTQEMNASVERGGTVGCPGCGLTVSADATICPRCGRQLAASGGGGMPYNAVTPLNSPSNGYGAAPNSNASTGYGTTPGIGVPTRYSVVPESEVPVVDKTHKIYEEKTLPVQNRPPRKASDVSSNTLERKAPGFQSGGEL